MNASTIQILIAMVVYMGIVIGIGVAYASRANQNSEEYFLGGRSLGPWVTAMSAEASDMSGWLLMGEVSALKDVSLWKARPLSCSFLFLCFIKFLVCS